MVYSERLYQPSVLELARQGNLQAIAYWINSYLVPQGIYASVRASRAGCLQILIEFQRIPERDRLVRFICHRLYKLNSNVIAGVQIVARFAGDSHILWQQSVRLAPSPRHQRSQRRQRQSQSYVQQLLLSSLAACSAITTVPQRRRSPLLYNAPNLPALATPLSGQMSSGLR